MSPFFAFFKALVRQVRGEFGRPPVIMLCGDQVSLPGVIIEPKDVKGDNDNEEP